VNVNDLPPSACFVGRAYRKRSKDYTVALSAQKFARSTGTGSLEAARGSVHVWDGIVALSGENDIFGPFSTATWAAASVTRTAWNGGTWMGRDFAGTGWTTSAGGLQSWSARTCPARTWSGRTWSSDTWASMTWNSATWSRVDALVGGLSATHPDSDAVAAKSSPRPLLL
jgi:serine protease AprX